MWKYVSRRLKETTDRANNILDVHKTWNYTPQTVNTSDSAGCPFFEKNKKPNKLVSRRNCPLGLWFTGAKKSKEYSDNTQDQKEKYYNEEDCKIRDSLLGAIKWSGALICGLYASQLLCLRRRHFGWENKSPNRYIQILNIPSRELHLNAYSYLAFAAPKDENVLSKRLLEKKPDHQEPEAKTPKKVFDINNNRETSVPNVKPKTGQTIAESVAELVTFLGETEYKFASENLAVGDYRSAVIHLKAATSHHHASATFNLGLCYEKGLGITRNLERAMECYQIASSMGHSKAIYNLGVYYARGLGGLKKDINAARRCFVTAAKLGQAEAKIALGLKVNDIIDDKFNDFIELDKFAPSTSKKLQDLLK